jgi:hypothetical protein
VIHPFAAVATGAGFTSPDSPGADALSEAGRDDALRPATPAYSGTSSTGSTSFAAAVASIITAIETTITGAPGDSSATARPRRD